MDELLTFEPDPDHRPFAGTGLLSSIANALQRGILLYVGKIPRTGIGRPSKQQRVVLRRRNTVVGGKCALPSALLVINIGYLLLGALYGSPTLT